ncbi:MAG: cytochrome-c peroxidase [Bacteroidetes bacterium]|nr:MAG: cytochrome-c peroxidase [Bacteroidota bacterium]
MDCTIKHTKTGILFLAILGLWLGLEACQKDSPITEPDAGNPAYELSYQNLSDPDIPADNPLTVEGVKLGRLLFYEKMLSGDGTQSCADCHRQSNAFSDTARFSTGIAGMQGKRQAMAVFNMLWNSNGFFWDGRASLLRHQALLPIQDPLEMNESLSNVVNKLSNSSLYPTQFEKAFGSREITETLISLALEQFMNSITSSSSKYDDYLQGKQSLSASEERGRKLFFAEYNPFFPEESGADCAHCHSGNNFENDLYMNNGLDTFFTGMDIGHQKVTNNANDRSRFKVTSLRNIELTQPYMHDGRFQTLEEVIDHYNSGLFDSPTLDPALKNTLGTGLMLDVQDKADLIAFLKTLTDTKLISNPAYANPH